MTGHKIGYIRVSSVGQNTERQLEGVALDKEFTEKASAKTKERPVLSECIDYLRAGDELHVHSIDRLARNLTDLESIVSSLNDKGVSVRFHKEGLTFSGDASPMNKLTLQMMGAFAEFERSMIRERQAEGIAAAKKKGTRFGKPSKLSQEQITEIKRLAAERYNKTGIAKQFGISRQTLYNVLQAE